MGKHDELSHFLHIPKHQKFNQPKPATRPMAHISKSSQRLGALNRRG